MSVHLCHIILWGFRLLKRGVSRSCSGVWPTLRWSLPGVCWSAVLMWFLCSCRAGIPKCFCLLPPALHDFWWFCFPLSPVPSTSNRPQWSCPLHLHPTPQPGSGPSQWTSGALPPFFTVPSSSLSYHSDSRQAQMSASWSQWSPCSVWVPAFCALVGKLSPTEKWAIVGLTSSVPYFKGYCLALPLISWKQLCIFCPVL